MIHFWLSGKKNAKKWCSGDFPPILGEPFSHLYFNIPLLRVCRVNFNFLREKKLRNWKRNTKSKENVFLPYQRESFSFFSPPRLENLSLKTPYMSLHRPDTTFWSSSRLRPNNIPTETKTKNSKYFKQAQIGFNNIRSEIHLFQIETKTEASSNWNLAKAVRKMSAKDRYR